MLRLRWKIRMILFVSSLLFSLELFQCCCCCWRWIQLNRLAKGHKEIGITLNKRDFSCHFVITILILEVNIKMIDPNLPSRLSWTPTKKEGIFLPRDSKEGTFLSKRLLSNETRWGGKQNQVIHTLCNRISLSFFVREVLPFRRDK